MSMNYKEHILHVFMKSFCVFLRVFGENICVIQPKALPLAEKRK